MYDVYVLYIWWSRPRACCGSGGAYAIYYQYDLLFFADTIWPLGMDLTAGKFLFLGDFVDRGSKGLEVLAYLFSYKICVPNKLLMIRGNHEVRKS